MVNGRISGASFKGYMRIRPFVGRVLSGYRRLFAKSPRDAARLVALGAPQERVVVAGNLKFFSVYSSSLGVDAASLREEFGVPNGARLWVCGSTHEGEEAVVADAYGKLRGKFPGLRLVVAPRHPERAGLVHGLLKDRGFSVARRSRGERVCDADVFLLDTVGELFPLYSLADVVFVGGSLVDVGGHNPLEPLVFFKPTIIGPHYHNFLDVVEDLRDYILVADASGLCGAVEKVLDGVYSFDFQGLREKFEKSVRTLEVLLDALEEVL